MLSLIFYLKNDMFWNYVNLYFTNKILYHTSYNIVYNIQCITHIK